MAVKLHRCSSMWVKIGGHPCWKVQQALDQQGVEYEVVKGPLRRGKRDYACFLDPENGSDEESGEPCRAGLCEPG